MCNNVHGINQLTSDEFNKILLTLIKFQEDLELRYCMSDFLNKNGIQPRFLISLIDRIVSPIDKSQYSYF